MMADVAEKNLVTAVSLRLYLEPTQPSFGFSATLLIGYTVIWHLGQPPLQDRISVIGAMKLEMFKIWGPLCWAARIKIGSGHDINRYLQSRRFRRSPILQIDCK